MKKLICIFSVALILVLASVSGFAITAYENAPGGDVTTAEELVSALGGNAVITKSGAIRLETDIVLLSTVTVKEGSYTIIGGGCGIYRGFDSAPLIKLEGGASLTLEKSSQNAYVDDNDQDLLFSGRRSEFPNGGSLIKVCGGAELTVNNEVVFENSVSGTLGGAIYAEGGSKVTLNNCGFRNCTSTVGGGAVAFVSDKLGSDGGSLKMSGASFKGNTSVNAQNNAKGGAIYVYGGSFESDSCIFENNTADLGGVMWLCSEAKVSNADCSYNESNVSGAVLYCESDSSMVGTLNVANGMYMNNTSKGNGGFASNYGAMIIGGAYVADNVADGDGGAVYNEGSLAFTEGTLTYNTCGGRGGGVCNIGRGSIFVMSDGEINSNKALFGTGIFSEGAFSMNGGAIGGSDKAHDVGLVLYSDMTLGGSAMIYDTVALCFNGERFPNIKINGSLSEYYSVMLVGEKSTGNGAVSRYAIKNSAGVQVLTGNVASNVDKFRVENSFLRYGINSNGKMTVTFPVFPAWVWICVLVLALLSAGTVFYFKVGKRLIKEFKSKKKDLN